MATDIIRKQIQLEGLIQGVGFRPFVFNLAKELSVKGWVANTIDGITLELEGNSNFVVLMIERIQQENPPHSQIMSLQIRDLAPVGYTGFSIQESAVDGTPSVYVQPDIAACPDCLKECFNPENRRYLYPFISCSHCGPRFSIIESLPFDRGRTSMKQFPLCPLCQAEYDSPNDRRFHAQTNVCDKCGPKLELWDACGNTLAGHGEAINHTVIALTSGKIVALKGIGGFQLLVEAGNEDAVARLRNAKVRPEKPFAVMFPNTSAVNQVCYLTPYERKLLCSTAAPIVLLKRKGKNELIADNVAPDNTNLGVMLPHSPLHHILMAKMQCPIVATSGNRSEEPICIDEKVALQQLKGLAQYYLVHNRQIIRPLDDSVVCELFQKKMILRHARGYAPLSIKSIKSQQNILALGGHQKNTVAFSKGSHIILSQQIGSLDTLASVTSFKDTIRDLCDLYQIQTDIVVRDKHPDYYSSQHAQSMAIETMTVQHHHAHALACMVEHQLSPPVLGIVWDGSGYGEDGNIWGGEFLLIKKQGYVRQASFLPLMLPGGSAAIKEPRRSALGLLYGLYGDKVFTQTDWPLLSVFTKQELFTLQKMITKQINTPKCSSVGRLFDGMASLLGLCQIASFEGQAATLVEQAVTSNQPNKSYAFHLIENASSVDIIDWKPMLSAVIND
ncbi:MAG: carbamoyltransferase HypF, partial [Methylococcaceae bacterium]